METYFGVEEGHPGVIKLTLESLLLTLESWVLTWSHGISLWSRGGFPCSCGGSPRMLPCNCIVDAHLGVTEAHSGVVDASLGLLESGSLIIESGRGLKGFQGECNSYRMTFMVAPIPSSKPLRLQMSLQASRVNHADA